MAVQNFKLIPHFQILFMLLVVITPRYGQSVTFTKNPSDEVAVEGKGVAAFTCAVNANGGTAEMKWFKDNDQELNNMGRFEIVQNSGDFDQSLIITNPEQEDGGLYFCRFGNEASAKGRLHVLPSSWLPKCERTPSSGRIPVGDAFNISCTSTGHVNTSLRWFVPDGLDSSAPDGVKTKSAMAISIRYNGTITVSGSSLLFVCEATLDSLSESCSVSINDEKPADPFPFIVVGLMSLIALLLFFVVLFILFRHRQCRFCQEAMLEPHTVLDADALQTGAWIPPPVVAIDISISEDEGSVRDAPLTYVNMDFQSLSQPPDVVPTQELNGSISETDQHQDACSVSSPEAAPEVAVERNVKTATPDPVVLAADTKAANKPKSKKKNHTLTKNMDQNFEKPTQTLEKKALPTQKTRPSGKREKKKIKHYKEPPVKARMKTPKDPIYAQVKKLNVPSKSVPGGEGEDTPSTSTGLGKKTTQAPTPPPWPESNPDADSKETSSIATGETDSTDQSPQIVNDLGRGDSKKKRVRHYRKKSEGSRKNSDQEDVVLNILVDKDEPATQSNGSSKVGKKNKKTPADRVIYAELDFSKKVGLNIIE